MNESTADVFFGMFLGGIVVAGFVLIVAISGGVAKNSLVDDCRTFGKVEVGRKLYECSFKEIAK